MEPKKTKSYFITSSGTNVGKTFILCSLINMLVKENYDVSAIKPIITGWEANDSNMDTFRIIKSLDLKITQNLTDKISPWRFKEPLSPDIAANIENKTINFHQLLSFCKTSCNSEYNLIEGIGGVMVPLNKDKTILDLIKSLDIPVILIVGNYLGSISHTLTAIKAIESYSIDLHSVILTENEINNINTESVLRSIRNFSDADIFKIPNVKEKNFYEDFKILKQII